MRKTGKIHFITGFILGAIVFGTISAYAATEIIARALTSKILLNDKEVKVEAYNINGGNYVRLTELSKLIGFDVQYEAATDTIKMYSNSNPKATAINTPVQQPQADIKKSNDTLKFDYKVGDTPAHIVKDPKNFDHDNSESYTDFYRFGSIGECTWYAKGRFYEVHGIDTTTRFFGSPRNWLENVPKFNDIQIVTNINDIQSKSIAIYKVPTDPKANGHVLFIEFVEKDSQGNPTNVYVTECNGKNTLNKGQFDLGYDGVVQKLTFDELKAKYDSGLVGYLIPKE